MILRRYMTQQVALNTALVLGFLLILLLGGRMIRYFGLSAEGRLDVGLLFAIIGYNLPYFLELLLPLSFFIALMLVFGRLYVDHEMAVLNGSGVSRGRLARLMTPLIVALFVVEAGVTLVAKPWGVGQSDDIWASQALTQAFDLIEPKSFISNDDYHLYVGGMSADRTELHDVILVQTGTGGRSEGEAGNPLGGSIGANVADEADNKLADETVEGSDSLTEVNEVTEDAEQATADTKATGKAKSKDTIVLAKRAVQVGSVADALSGADSVADAQGGRTQLDLYQGRRFEVGADNKAYNQVSFERYRISLNTPPKDAVTEENVETQPLSTLWQSATGAGTATKLNPSNEAGEGQSLRQSAQAELGYRLALPWLMILAPMLAVPLAQVRPRQGRWLRLMPAIMIFTASALVIISLKSSISKGNAPVWAYAGAIVGFMALALYLNWASRIHHRVRFGLRKSESHQAEIGQGGK